MIDRIWPLSMVHYRCRVLAVSKRLGTEVQGRRGSAATWGDGETWMLVIRCRSALAWTWAKKRLAFAEVTQDGDDEGVLRLHRLPSPAEAAEIRDILGIWQTRPPEIALRFASLKRISLAPSATEKVAIADPRARRD